MIARSRWIILPSVFLLVSLLSVLDAKQPPAQCGTHPTRRQEELFLHGRHTAMRARNGLAAAAEQRLAVTNRDIGNIAVIEDSGGVIGRRNLFDLDRTTLTFRPMSGGYSVQVSGDSFDPAAATVGTLIQGLADDASRETPLPFSLPFFGTLYPKLWVNSNGNLSFTAGDSDSSASFGHFASGLPRIAALYTDLDPSQSADGVRVLADASRVVITWSSVPLYSSSSFSVAPIQNFQVRLYPDGKIEIAYRSAGPPAAVVGITQGGEAQVDMIDFASKQGQGPAGPFATGVAESFSQVDALDVVAAAQRFYQTHDDAYDYLVFYNSANVPAGIGVVAFEITTRSNGLGYGDTSIDNGELYGSKKRLQAVLNLGPLSQYPQDPNAVVPSRFVSGDTPLTILGHEAGHLFLALASVRDPSNLGNQPMLGRSLVHWAFPFNSDASLLEGNRLEDAGPGVTPRFRSVATVQGYAALDQYLMGFRAPEEVAPTFVVLNSGIDSGRSPQTGIGFNGQRLDVPIDNVVQTMGRRTPDSTVAQRRFRFAFVLVISEGTQPGDAALAQVERYRSEFETAFGRYAGDRAAADTTLKNSVTLSLAPGAGVIVGPAGGTATIEIARPAATPITFTPVRPSSVLATPATVVLPAGSTRVTFPYFGNRVGVENFSLVPSDTTFETAYARVQVTAAKTDLHLMPISVDTQVLLRVVDRNNLPYPGVRVVAGLAPNLTESISDEHGQVRFASPNGSLNVSIDGLAATQIRVGIPAIGENGIVNGASFLPRIAAGGFVTITGLSLAAGTTASSIAPFPTALGGVQVKINGTPVPLAYVSDSQINLVAPANLVPGPANVTVETALGVSAAVRVQVEEFAPGIFFDSASGFGAILIAGTASTTQSRPALPGDFLEIYCTGLGISGGSVKVQIAGAEARVVFTGQTAIPGLYQVNVQVPADAPVGSVPLTLSINGVASNSVKVLVSSRPSN